MTALGSTYEGRVSRLTGTEAVPPGSKSITNRAALIAALSEGESVLTGALDAEDTRVMFDALCALGFDSSFDAASRTMRIRGLGGRFPNKQADIYVGNSGTTTRFLSAALAFAEEGEYRLDGKARMRERPIGDLLRALNALGRGVVSLTNNDCPPLAISGRPNADRTPCAISIAANVSSQFLSGLLMAAPLAKREITAELDGELASKPYVAMTLEVMRAFGVEAKATADYRRFYDFHVGKYVGREYAIEPDASAASYFFALPAILGGEMTIRNLSRGALQGDVGFVDYLEQMGCQVEWNANSIKASRAPDAVLHGVDVDLNKTPDVAQTLAVAALYADSPTTIRNVANMRVKETDRIAALVAELRKMGAYVEEREDGLTVDPTRSQLHGASIKTYDDHRMAMSFALAALRTPGVTIEDPKCVAKTYPNFFDDLERVTAPM